MLSKCLASPIDQTLASPHTQPILWTSYKSLMETKDEAVDALKKPLKGLKAFKVNKRGLGRKSVAHAYRHQLQAHVTSLHPFQDAAASKDEL